MVAGPLMYDFCLTKFDKLKPYLSQNIRVGICNKHSRSVIMNGWNHCWWNNALCDTCNTKSLVTCKTIKQPCDACRMNWWLTWQDHWPTMNTGQSPQQSCHSWTSRSCVLGRHQQNTTGGCLNHFGCGAPGCGSHRTGTAFHCSSQMSSCPNTEAPARGCRAVAGVAPCATTLSIRRDKYSNLWWILGH